MTTLEEAQADLSAARDTLFPHGQWEDLFHKLNDAYNAQVLQDHDQGEMAFYLGEACLYTNRPEAETYLTHAYHYASTDFSAWAEEELRKLHQHAADPHAADPHADGRQDAEAHPAQDQQPAVDVSSHPALQLNSPYPDWVAHAQAKLAHLQYYNGRIDGYFGPVTDAAVRHLQGAYGMSADGVIGHDLWLALETHAPGVTGHPDGSAGQHHDPAQHDQHAQPAQHDQHADPGEMTMPADTINPTPAPDLWNPLTPGVAAPGQEHEKADISEAGEIEFSHKIPVDKSYGPVTVKEIPVKISGKLSTEEARFVAVTNRVGAVKIETGSWDLFEEGGWKIALKGNAEVSNEGGIAAVLELTHGAFIGEIEFALAKLDHDEFHFAEITGSVGGQVENHRIRLEDGTVVYFSGKVSGGVTLAPNVEWFARRGLEAATDTAETVTTGAEAAATGAEATTTAGEGATTVAEGGAAAGAGELIIATGFIAGAVATLYVGYVNIQDQEKLQVLRTDADKAVVDFAKGFVAAWTTNAAPGGYWGGVGAAAGQKQFDADVHGFEELMHRRHPGQILDAATMEEVKQSWHQAAATRQSGFEAVAEAMFGKMVRTAIYQAWLRANSDSSLPGDIRETAKAYAGIPGGSVTEPDVMAGQAAAHNANLQMNIDSWHNVGRD